MQNKDVNMKKHTLITAISVLLCFAAIASTTAFILSRFSLKRAHEIKWSDYDDCGMAWLMEILKSL